MDEKLQKLNPYMDFKEHLNDCLILVKLFLQRHLLLFTDRYLDSKGDFTNLFVSRKEVEKLLSSSEIDENFNQNIEQVNLVIDEFKKYLSHRVKVSADAGINLPLVNLFEKFNINEYGRDIIIALLAPEINTSFGRAYTHAWTDFTKKHIDVGFLLDLVGKDESTKNDIRKLLCSESTLIQYRILILSELPDRGQTTRFIEQSVKIDTRVLNFIFGETDLPFDLVSKFNVYIKPPLNENELFFPEELMRSFISAVNYKRIILTGPSGCGKKTLAGTMLNKSNRKLLVLNMGKDVEIELIDRMTMILREAILQDAEIYIDNIDYLFHEKEDASKILNIANILSYFPHLVVIGLNQKIPKISNILPDFIEIEVPFPCSEDQQKLWERFFQGLPPVDENISDIVSRYSLSGGAIEKSVNYVRKWMTRQSEKVEKIPADVILTGLRDQLSHRLGSLAVPVYRGASFNDFIVPKKTRDLLEEIIVFFKHRQKILREWGFGKKLIHSKGIAALFFGPPGTGKTMAATIIAKDIGMEIFQIDLSRIVDKYVGETEKNLAKIFDEGAMAQAVLLFDEADSLFAKRTDVRTSIDRYSNLEVNFLLQRIESYNGISILTTNFPSALDEAFKRRIRFWVEFPFPTEEERKLLWQSMVPKEAPLGKDVDFDELANKYVLAGGNIKNAIIRAASYAADKDQIIDMACLRKAADKEYLNLGKLVREDREEF